MKRTIIGIASLTLTLIARAGTACGLSAGSGSAAQLPASSVMVPVSPDVEMESQSGVYTLDDVRRLWSTRTVAVPGDKSDITALFLAFNHEWPTYAGNRIAHDINPELVPEGDNYEEGSIVDRKNGYVQSAWYEGETIGSVSACVWRRGNGHKLFAVAFECHAKGFICFYDFDPAKRTITPEQSPVKPEQLNNPDMEPLWYVLPQEGKTVSVVEDGPGEEVVITLYEFDGQNLRFAGRQ